LSAPDLDAGPLPRWLLCVKPVGLNRDQFPATRAGALAGEGPVIVRVATVA